MYLSYVREANAAFKSDLKQMLIYYTGLTNHALKGEPVNNWDQYNSVNVKDNFFIITIYRQSAEQKELFRFYYLHNNF